jgi:hypothetical protein
LKTLSLKDIKLETLIHCNESMTPIDFEVKSKVKDESGQMNILTTQYLKTPEWASILRHWFFLKLYDGF